MIDQLISNAAAQAGTAGEVQEDSSASSSSSSSPGRPQVPPRDPLNPLEQAYNLAAYEQRQRAKILQFEKEYLASLQDEPDWDHEPYFMRSPSPCRARTDGAFAKTRKG